MDEVLRLKPGEVLTILIDKDNKNFVTFAIKAEELPVVYEEMTEKEVTRFVIRLK